MKIRQYTAGTMQEARLKIKMDLGPDAVILHTRSFKKGGLFGFFGKEMVEVLAAVDSPDLGAYTLPRPDATARVPQAAPQPFSVPTPSQPFAPAPSQPLTQAQPFSAPSSSQSLTSPVPDAEQRSDVAELKEAVGEVKRMLGAVVEQLEQAPVRGDWPASLTALHERLLGAELAAPLAKSLVSKLHEAGVLEPTPDALRNQESLVSSWLSCTGAIEMPSHASQRPKVVALVGPTGVGKTTTIAKLAANFRLIHQKDVALITIDTYRVAAVEQLRTYGDIIGIPVEVVVTPSALREAIARFADKDVILIDTAGRSPSNRMHLHELRGFLDFPQAKEIHLVLSATTNRANLERVVEAFAPVGIDRVIFTKIDETASFGAMVSVAHGLGKPLSYLTTGQSVPDDIRTADPEAIARMLIDEIPV